MTAALRDNLIQDGRDARPGVRALAARLRGLVAPVVALSVIAALALAFATLASWVHEATLIEVVRVEGSFRATTQNDIQKSMSSLVAGHSLLAVPMDEIARELSALSWVSAVDVYRVWPHGLIVRVTEKVPVAKWNGSGFISHTGEVFQPENAAGVAELPLLAGPADKAPQVMAFYSSVNSMLMPFGLAVRELTLNDALSWEIVLGNGIRLRLDQEDGQTRLRRFLHVYEQRLFQVVDRIATVDLRYIGGFAVGWKPAAVNKTTGMPAGTTTPGGENGSNHQQ
jgi:cell division protein FtsQ